MDSRFAERRKRLQRFRISLVSNKLKTGEDFGGGKRRLEGSKLARYKMTIG